MNIAQFFRDTWAEVDLDCIFNNVKNMKEHLGKGKEIIAVVKADGYGHDAYHVALIALEAGATSVAVALLDEAILLRKKGIKAPILVMGWIRPEDVHVALNYDITVTAFQLEWFELAARQLEETSQLSIHLKLDTGMGRLGIKEKNELDDVLAYLSHDKRFSVDGVFTHFATADETDQTYFLFQYEKFKQMLKRIESAGFTPTTIHCANSAAGLRFPEKVISAVRFGISMYGLVPSIEIKNLLPFPLEQAFTLHSKLVHVKKLKSGEKVSYGGTYEASGEEWIGTIPIGYADGWLRKLKDSDVLVDGQRCEIVGRICMDQMMIKLPAKLSVGTKVTLIGKQGNDEVTVDDVASILETINYEIPCMISYRVPRIIFRKRRIIEVKHFFDNNG